LSTGKERLSFAVIRTSLGLGGSFLAAAFVLQAYLSQGFLIPAAVVTFILVSLTVRAFAGIRITVFSLLTVSWLVLLSLIHILIASVA
jgi:hypothetical protein